jgi:hypothetical protein
MDRFHHDVHPENRRFVDLYLFDDSIMSAHHVLKSTKTAEEYDEVAPELRSFTCDYTTAEEERLKKNLESIGYNLDAPSTVTLITGPGRIERVSVLTL